MSAPVLLLPRPEWIKARAPIGERYERLRDLISVCEFRSNEFTPESAVRFLKESGFFDI